MPHCCAALIAGLLYSAHAADNRKTTRANGTLHVPWQKTPSTRRREILLPEGMPPHLARPIRSETRATLVAAIARGRRWLDELTNDPSVTTESIAQRENCSIRKINMTISLAFLAPDLVKAAIDGRLPRGMGIARLIDLPAAWPKQHEMIGLRRGECTGIGGRRFVSERGVWPRGVVIGDPGNDELTGLIEIDEQALIEKLVAHAAIEGLDVAVLHGSAGAM
jgi:hypothetical protein